MTVNSYKIEAPQHYPLDHGAGLWLWPALLNDNAAKRLFEQLLSAADWQQPLVQVFAKWHRVPRMTCWYGDAGVRYRYAGMEHSANGWPETLTPLRAAIETLTGLHFNSVLANLYRDGHDSMGYHSDDEAELGEQPWIASFSLGAERDFVLRPKYGAHRGQCLRLPLQDNQLLLMNPAVQHHYQHALPRRARVHQSRINLTFRLIR
ncbi:MAG: alpha-ketoglutarate-dependent dioxygenase AlkB [Alcanivorax sp.]|nr:alpha-ketoglutarate-dependent dioxygenase AlkB [Alcanivorax sp.]